MHPSDWPYERAPLAAECGPGWRAVADACRPHGPLVLAGLGHAGGQGSSAYSQSALWAPSPVADVVAREMPMAMGRPRSTPGRRLRRRRPRWPSAPGSTAWRSTPAPSSLLRQFHSGLTNQRGDDYGEDRLRLTRRGARRRARARSGPSGIVALRLSCDELAPWAGVTPEHGADHVAALAGAVDLLTVVRGGPYSTTAYRPDAHTPPASTSTVRGHATGGRRSGSGRAAGQRGRPGVGRGRPRRRHRRSGRDDPGPDRRSPPGRQLAAPGRRSDSALHPLQPGLPGPRQPQSHRHLRRRAPIGP